MSVGFGWSLALSDNPYYGHTNRFCVVQESITPVKNRPSLRCLCIKTECFIFSVK